MACSILLLTGCSNIPAKHQEAINKVVKLVYNCPNEEFAEEFQVIDEEMNLPENSDLSKDNVPKLTEFYNPYINDEILKSQLYKQGLTIYQRTSIKCGYKITVNKIDIEKNKNTDNKYKYKTLLTVETPNDGTKTVNASGIFKFDEADKVTYFEAVNDEKLLMEMLNLNK